jgi:UDP-arabinose 4-epimerase
VNILVTGGAGYIGSHTCKALSQKGFQPIVVDNLIYGHEWAVQWGPFYKASLHDTERLAEIMRREKIEAVIHFAAFAYVGESYLDPLKYYTNNVNGTVSLLNAMKLSGVKRIVFSSSCATYGVPERSPIEENFEQKPINPYGQTKLIVENILKDLAALNELKSVSLRYFNAAGADKELEIGEDHNPETHLIPLTLEAIFKKEKSLTVFGTDYPTPDGTCIRDYVHVTDLAAAHVCALESLGKNPNYSRAYNLGTGHGASVLEIIKAAELTTGKKVNVTMGERRPGDPPSLVASPGRAKLDLGWEPKYSSLENILATAAAWYEKHHLQN